MTSDDVEEYEKLIWNVATIDLRRPLKDCNSEKKKGGNLVRFTRCPKL